MKTFETLAELATCVGQDVAVSDWLTIDQARIDRFAEATGDHQWIHVDPGRARTGPFGTTIAHGFLTLSLLPWFLENALAVTEARMGVNYGLNRVRFTAPVPVDSRLRGHLHLLGAEVLADGGWQFTWRLTVEREGAERPVCVAESLARLYA
ncbi:MAG: MaoC family dehydratase [Hydrogenophaga sp.]|jgi:acyl dehydratase|uniref:MaoC family dehydratase n=1 Tax=Hydrogenophaga sp. TaxID=1904254 RepID=UPI000EE547BE|nr:MaoC family dehydratase [Hydrogenophaga sp.]MDD3784641.1 MaoC family dehydratase [Hydrogenophaga sp.]MDX9969639.1 MaoC family dehydratase [Hydrogenophaga sp.]HAJ13380.1 dehydratase [Comamonadaceae bacterium]